MAGNSKDSKILAYKDMINQLNKSVEFNYYFMLQSLCLCGLSIRLKRLTISPIW